MNICFPEKNREWQNQIVKKNYINIFITLFEFFYLGKLNKSNIRKYINFNGEVDENVFLDKEKLRFFISGHFSNWELSAFSFPLLFNEGLDIVVKTQANHRIDDKINELRRQSGNEVIHMGQSLRELYGKIHNKEIICFLIDQSAHSEYSVYAEFFGKKVASFAGPAKLALKFRPFILLGLNIRKENYQYEIITKEIKYDDLTEVNDYNITELTNRMQKHLEEVIKIYPDQWLWFHKRFKYMKE